MKKAGISILLLLLITTIPGCLVVIPEPQQSTPPQQPVIEPADIIPIDPGWSPDIYSGEPESLPSIADVVEKTFNSVVAINTEVVVDYIFQGSQTQQGAGSGWILREDGVIVTNNHVVEGANKITVELSDGRTYQTGRENVYRDPRSDLAVVKIATSGLPAATVGNSENLRLGEWVVALGNPLGQGLRIKEGTVSGLKVSLPVEQGQRLYDLIETSAAINPGNSGGPLMDMMGHVIGITSAKIAAIGVEGLGYAISTHTAMPIIEELINKGYVVRPYLGVGLYTIDPYVALINRLPVEEGVVVTEVVAGSPADKAGIKEMDIITAFNGEEVTTDEELIQKIISSQIGQSVEITYIREGTTSTARAVLTESPVPAS